MFFFGGGLKSLLEHCRHVINLIGNCSILVAWSVLDGAWSVRDGARSVLDGAWSVLDGA